MHKEDDEIKLEEHLRKMHNKGVNLYLEDRPASPEEIARKFFCQRRCRLHARFCHRYGWQIAGSTV